MQSLSSERVQAEGFESVRPEFLQRAEAQFQASINDGVNRALSVRLLNQRTEDVIFSVQ